MSAFKTIATAYKNVDEKTGDIYLAVTLKEDMKAGQKLYLRKNQYKKEKIHPDFVYMVRTEEPVL